MGKGLPEGGAKVCACMAFTVALWHYCNGALTMQNVRNVTVLRLCKKRGAAAWHGSPFQSNFNKSSTHGSACK